MSLTSIYIYVHSDVLSAFPIYFYGIQLAQSRNEVIHTLLIRPKYGEVVDDERESNRPVVISEKGRRVRTLKVAVCF